MDCQICFVSASLIARIIHHFLSTPSYFLCIKLNLLISILLVESKMIRLQYCHSIVKDHLGELSHSIIDNQYIEEISMEFAVSVPRECSEQRESTICFCMLAHR